MQATMKAGAELMDKLGNQTDTTADKLERFLATTQNLKVAIGSGLIRVFYFLEGTFISVAAASLAISGGIFKIIESAASLTDTLHITSGAAAEWKMNAEAAFGAANELAMKADQSFKDMSSSNDAIIAGQAEYQKKIRETTQALGDQDKARNKALGIHKTEAEERANAEREMYEEAGFGAEKYYSQEATELVNKAKRWKEAGADIYQVEQWLYDQIGKLSVDAWQKGEFAAGQAMDSMQAQSGVLTEQLGAANEAILGQLNAVGIKTDELNGKEIGITARFEGGQVVSGIDSLISKFEQLRVAAVSPGVTNQPGSNSTQKQYENNDPNMSASQVAEAQNSFNNGNNRSTTININQKLSRSDVTSIVNEQERIAERS